MIPMVRWEVFYNRSKEIGLFCFGSLDHKGHKEDTKDTKVCFICRAVPIPAMSLRKDRGYTILCVLCVSGLPPVSFVVQTD
jgi:hypothetical protein